MSHTCPRCGGEIHRPKSPAVTGACGTCGQRFWLPRHPILTEEDWAVLAAHDVHRPKIVCLCGSTRFMDAFFEVGWQLTLDGCIVLSVGVCKHAEHHGAEALGQDVADRLDDLHLRKIDLADEVRILNVGGYIGESTRRELEYAKTQGKQVTFLEPEVTHDASEGRCEADGEATDQA